MGYGAHIFVPRPCVYRSHLKKRYPMNNVSRNTAPYLFPFIRPSQDNGARANLYEGTDKQPQLIQESQIL